MTLEGDIVSIYPHNMTRTVDALHASPLVSKELTLLFNTDYTENGPAGTWNYGGGMDSPEKIKIYPIGASAANGDELAIP